MIEIDLERYFSPEAIRQAYQSYEKSKTDRFHLDQIRIPMGADGIKWEDFKCNLDKNAQNISRRVLNGSYQFYPLREVKVLKPGKKNETRPLAIASIRDALVQRQLYEALYNSAEEMFAKPKFNGVSFAYRKGKSAPYAANRIWQSIKQQGYNFAFDADIRKFFDTLNHDRLKMLIDEWVGVDTIVGTLLWRYVRTDIVPHESYPHSKNWQKYFMENKPERRRRDKGVPQGGVLSGMLANLYLHEFDCWVIEELGSRYNLRYYRYADDFVILTRNEEDAWELYGNEEKEIESGPVAVKLKNDLKLEIHPDKTRVCNIFKEGLTFVGFKFTVNKVKAKKENIERFKKRFLSALIKEPLHKSKNFELTSRLRFVIEYCVNPKILGAEPEICDKCNLPKDRRRNWMAFFASVVSDVSQLRELDRWMRQQICKYFRNMYGIRLNTGGLKQVGMKTLIREYYRQRKTSPQLCQCSSSYPEKTAVEAPSF